MLVKCLDLKGEKRPKEDCYKAPNKRYYSCKAAYDAVVRRTELKNKCTDFMQGIMGYESDMKLPTSWYKFLEEFSTYGFDVVLETLEVNEKTFRWALQTKNFKNDSHALNYFKAIIQNNIMEQYRAKIAREKAERKAMADEEKLRADVPNYIPELGQSGVKGKNLSNLVGIYG